MGKSKKKNHHKEKKTTLSDKVLSVESNNKNKEKEIEIKQTNDNKENFADNSALQLEDKITETVLSKEEDAIPKPEYKDILYTKKNAKAIESKHIQMMVMTGLKIALPVAALAIVIAVLFSFANTKKNNEIAEANDNIEVFEVQQTESTAVIPEEPLEENVHDNVNALMNRFYTALAEGDLETIKGLRDYNDETELITTEKKSEYIESYDNIVCYTKEGLEENSYFVYVSYDVKIEGIETKAPGLNAFYVYTKEDGNLIIDGNMEENVEAALKLVTSQDEVVDLYTRVDVSYNEAITADEALNNFMLELPTKIKTSVGEALAQLEAEDESEVNTEEVAEASATEDNNEAEPQNQVVNQIVKATDTVNVRSSDSEEADKIGRVETGTELTRTEVKINGWSKVIYEGKEAYIKSDYLETVEENDVNELANTIKATTNVNVRSKASQDSDAIGTAQAGNSYEVLENLGEWCKISYNGQEGYVKSEYFE